VLTLSTYRSPSLPTPSRPRIDRIVHEGDSLAVFFSPGDTPIAAQPTISLSLRTSFGEQLSLMLARNQLRAIGPQRGLGAATQAGEYEAVIPGIDPTATVHISLAGTFDGRQSPAARTQVRPAFAGVDEARLLRLARQRRCSRRARCAPVLR
jgi:hypothetical protein